MRRTSAGPQSGRGGRAALGKTMVVLAVEHAGGDALGRTRMQIIPDARTDTLKGFLAASVAPGSEVMTGGLTSYPGATEGYRHQVRVVHRSGHQAYELLPEALRVAFLAQRWMAAHLKAASSLNI